MSKRSVKRARTGDPEVYGGFDYAKLREDADIHSAFTHEKVLREGLDAHFNGYAAGLPYYTAQTEERAVKISDYWTYNTAPSGLGVGELKCPSTLSGISARSKRAYSYPTFTIRTKLPQLSGLGYNPYVGVWFGFENGESAYDSLAAFNWSVSATDVERLRAYVASQDSWSYADLTSLIPSDIKATAYFYAVKVNRSNAEFYVNRVLRAVAVFSPNLNLTTINGPPYAIFGLGLPVNPYLTVLLEIPGEGKDLSLPVHPFHVRFADGDPCPPRVYRLYQAGTSTLLAGSTLSSGSVTSHPIPVFGYGGKTLYLQANQAGSLVIEVLTQAGNWRTYDSDTISADTLWWYKMTGDAVLARLAFTPTTYPCTIAEAEAVLIG
jgi:hypothetical protein